MSTKALSDDALFHIAAALLHEVPGLAPRLRNTVNALRMGEPQAAPDTADELANLLELAPE